jgi:hypothetical protein
MATKKITPKLEPEVLSKAAEGWSSRRIAEHLGTAHNVKVSHVAVAAFLKETRETREEVAAAVTREALRPHVVSDLDRLEEIRQEIAKARGGKMRLRPPDRVALARLEKDLITTKLKFAGAGGGIPGVTAGALTASAVRRMAAEVLSADDGDGES